MSDEDERIEVEPDWQGGNETNRADGKKREKVRMKTPNEGK